MEGCKRAMMRLTENTEDRRKSAIEIRKDLVRRIAARVQSVGENPTALPGLALYRRDEPTPCFHATYEPSVSVFVQRQKAR